VEIVVEELKERPTLPSLRMIAWEVTRACNLDCIHCRAAAINEPPPGEFSTDEAKSFLDDVASFAKPVIILTGGEPLMRPDIFEIAAYGKRLGLNMVMAPNGTLVDEEVVRNLLEVGMDRVSISLDGSSSEIHDKFRRVPGAFEGALRGVGFLKKAGVSFQINTTVTRHNRHDLANILKLVKELDAAAWHVFLLVPTGRAKDMKEEEITPAQYEATLNWLYRVQRDEDIFVKPTCAPHYYRIYRQRAQREGKSVELPHQRYERMTRGCLGGISFCFVSHVGEVYPCGYLELLAGSVREEGFRKVWESSSLFADLRDFSKLKGRCGVCEFVKFCGGCRARAFALTGDYLEEEPYCVYQPTTLRKSVTKEK
jgi:heme b synthase